MAIGVIIFVVVMIILSFVIYGVIGVNLINNPESVGEWFSKLLKGYNGE